MKQIQFIGTTPTALIDLIDETVKNRLEDLKKTFQPKEPAEFLTRNEVAKMLSVNLSTIHNYCKRKILEPYQIGSRVYFKRSEVEQALVKLKN